MPQLDPSPWFFIFVISWAVFIYFIPPKVLSHTFPNDPVLLDSKKSKSNSWNWLWH
nr:ATP synthase protein 8 [Pseudoplesiops revellei]